MGQVVADTLAEPFPAVMDRPVDRRPDYKATFAPVQEFGMFEMSGKGCRAGLGQMVPHQLGFLFAHFHH